MQPTMRVARCVGRLIDAETGEVLQTVDGVVRDDGTIAYTYNAPAGRLVTLSQSTEWVELA